MEEEVKRKNLIEGLVYGLIGIAMGILFLVIPGDKLLKVLFIIIGILVIVFNIFPFIDSIKNLKYKTQIATSQFISSIIRIIIGILLIFFQGLLTIVVGILMLLFTIIDICLAKDYWFQELRNQLPAIIVSILLLTLGLDGIINTVLLIFGCVFITLSVAITILAIIKYFKEKN